MPDNIQRKRLKKKMLDRWENEGGRIAADSVIADQSNPANQREGEGGQAYGMRCRAWAGTSMPWPSVYRKEKQDSQN
jgi:hypothetical protein